MTTTIDLDILIRQSTIESFQLCPARVGYSNQPGFIDAPSEAIVFGSAMHLMIEEFLRDYESESRILVAPYIRDVIERVVAADGYDLNDLDPYNAFVPDMIDGLRFGFQQWLTHFWDDEGRWVHVIGIEEKLSTQIGEVNGRPVILQGTPDLITPNRLYDWKTAGRAWSEGKGMVRVQGPLYVYLSRLLEGTTLEAPAEMHYMVWDRGKGEWGRHVQVVREHNIEAALKLAMTYARQIEAQIFPATPAGESYGKYRRGWWCSAKYCGAWNICEFKGLVPDDVDLGEVKGVRW